MRLLRRLQGDRDSRRADRPILRQIAPNEYDRGRFAVAQVALARREQLPLKQIRLL